MATYRTFKSSSPIKSAYESSVSKFPDKFLYTTKVLQVEN